ncbi:MAG: NAD-binding protein [Deltaproteobacteria bacterium]|nr:NAD-binding protein [Deltaproteobacteria bacterium]
MALLVASIGVFSILFQVIMVYEGQQHSWLTGLYWTLTVMSTLGFGDITFASDLGRAFSIVVLMYGMVMLLIVAPFTFIRFFYAPWLEAQIRMRAPREVSKETSDHVVICGHDLIAEGLVARLDEMSIPYVVIEPEPATAAALHSEGINVVTGRRDARSTYEAVRVAHARMVIANLGDAENTNITLTVREAAADVPIVAFAEAFDSVDVLELAGATSVIPLKQSLGQKLATRVTAGTQTAHRIGKFENLVIAEFPIHGTSLVGRTIRNTNLRQLTGLNIVGVWERGQLQPAGPETVLHEHSVPVVVGTDEQVTELDALFVIYLAAETPVLVIGGGTVGQAVSQALRDRGASVTILDLDSRLEGKLLDIADRVVIGDAANIHTVKAAGIEQAHSVVLTTNDDATNILPHRLLSRTIWRCAYRQPDQPRLESRGDSSCRGRLRVESRVSRDPDSDLLDSRAGADPGGRGNGTLCRTDSPASHRQAALGERDRRQDRAQRDRNSHERKSHR